jgi:NitT/TauT family transport system permease protein
LAFRRAAWRLASCALVFGLWELAGRVPVSLAFPPFSATVVALGGLIADGSLPRAYLQTFQPLAIGLLVCGVLGVVCGIGMGLSRAVEWLALPVFVILQAAPMAALVPLITYIYGIGLTAKVLAVVFLAAPVVVMNAYKGIRNTPSSLLEMCRSFQGTRGQAIVKVVLPAASGLMFAGLRLGLAMGFVGVVVAELLITPTGVGDLITYHGSVADYPEMFATIASVVLIAAGSVGALARLERRLFPSAVGAG